jgi:hypothetical protein
MSIFIRNPKVEQDARELARLRGKNLTEVFGELVTEALELERAKPKPRPTLAEIKEATAEFRRKAGLDQVKLNITKADFDALWDIPELDPTFERR